MSSARSTAVAVPSLLTVRGLAVVPLAAFVVHWLRYELAFGAHADHELALTGHAYLGGVFPWLLVAATVALGASIAHVRGGSVPARRHSAPRAWLTLTATLVAIFVAQELLEGMFAAGHAPGLAGVFGDGGLWAVPAAMAVAGVLVLTRRGEQTLARLLRRLAAGAQTYALAPAAPRRRTSPLTVALAPLATSAAGRAPPRRALVGAA